MTSLLSPLNQFPPVPAESVFGCVVWVPRWRLLGRSMMY